MSSINSGFATRHTESIYNTVVYNLIYLLQYRLRKVYRSEALNESNYQAVLIRAVRKLQRMERSKFAKPKFSEALTDLCDVLTAAKKDFVAGGSDLAGLSDSLEDKLFCESTTALSAAVQDRITPEPQHQ